MRQQRGGSTVESDDRIPRRIQPARAPHDRSRQSKRIVDDDLAF
jgi:hypothetical protein